MTFPTEFRVWHVEFNEYLLDADNFFIAELQDERRFCIDMDGTYLNTYIIEFFTGLHDKHGTKVYDGDIVEITENTLEELWDLEVIRGDTAFQVVDKVEKYEVYWAEGHGGFALAPVNGDPACIFSLEQVKFSVVIGNKHDNKIN
jgi:uncharacterized phage protein (TIGR01671 family)